ncbi:MAG: NADPH-dependent oxidoreductase [Anaerolineales bacterium]|nr:NADPH-dependent oxidoreductase [Chloroflexota bacterium]MBL6980548.1 NADPH-dependent oxidoreductase [Anaerolineales bacterium]
MSNATIELLHKHGSVRNYKVDPVLKQMVETIVAAGQRASTSSNMQMYSVVATSDQDKRNRLMELCGGQKQIGLAPVFLAWCADLSRIARICEMQGYDNESGYLENFVLSVVDVSIMMQNAAIAAESLGLGMCYIGAIRNNPQEVIDLFDLPNLVFPVSGMTLGWPEKDPPIRPRLPLDAVLHWDVYNKDDEQHLKAYDQEMIATGIYKGRQVSGGDDKPEAVYGWTEHTARRASKILRPHLREVLQKAGFAMK